MSYYSILLVNAFISIYMYIALFETSLEKME